MCPLGELNLGCFCFLFTGGATTGLGFDTDFVFCLSVELFTFVGSDFGILIFSCLLTTFGGNFSFCLGTLFGDLELELEGGGLDGDFSTGAGIFFACGLSRFVGVGFLECT